MEGEGASTFTLRCQRGVPCVSSEGHPGRELRCMEKIMKIHPAHSYQRKVSVAAEWQGCRAWDPFNREQRGVSEAKGLEDPRLNQPAKRLSPDMNQNSFSTVWPRAKVEGLELPVSDLRLSELAASSALCRGTPDGQAAEVRQGRPQTAWGCSPHGGPSSGSVQAHVQCLGEVWVRSNPGASESVLWAVVGGQGALLSH